MSNGMEKLKTLTENLPSMKSVVSVCVLLVEDNPNIGKLVTQCLEYFGGDCTLVDNGKEAMDAIEKKEYQVLVGHIVMEEEIGVGVLRAFQKKNPKSMIVVISGSDDSLKDYGKYLSILALPFGFYDLIKTVFVKS